MNDLLFALIQILKSAKNLRNDQFSFFLRYLLNLFHERRELVLFFNYLVSFYVLLDQGLQLRSYQSPRNGGLKL